MFDPTAFDNIKFIMQAEVYDRELEGLLRVQDRKDQIDLAKLSREASITFSLKARPRLSVMLSISSSLEKLAGELLDIPEATPGVMLEITYSGGETVLTTRRMDQLEEQWGEGRRYERLKIESNQRETIYKHHIHFNRLITEDMIEEFGALVDFIMETLDDKTTEER
ncbi:hypothetical protein [Bacillus thermotolerans]|uniref:Uncharacterized protein n=1 Tax=Bacillus thermotolerans TaxID=1221996 RepID=A0A0F5HYS5_BACTR|nr:hypothetical protein [Bacillus thermotolerans]KKB37705.1 hypothetical protein QY95_02815 [Bacillus thermotolerans]KKB38519.1 hypothetical protein QY97_02428 [Bacillus thermotolerans]KKB39935.1 hypothetical protein QY96_02668 [Bacillus thermotolerans]